MASTDMNNIIGIPEYFKGKTVFITGFTGILGKLYTEKLLYSTPDIKKIYVMVRPKRGKTVAERVETVLDSFAFVRLQQMEPAIYKTKVIGIAGDLREDRLGLSSHDEKLLKNEVNIIIHSAATVSFNEPLNLTVLTNTKSTKMIVDLALAMPNLECLTYVSSAYSNSEKSNYIKEEIYPSKTDWQKTIEICDKIDPATMCILQNKFIGKSFDTYSFTKSLAEQIIDDYSHQIPVIVVRPSLVLSGNNEPVPGFNDTVKSGITYVAGYTLGLLRCFYSPIGSDINAVFSDCVVNATIAATWEKGISRKQEVTNTSTWVYNICSPDNWMNYFSRIETMAEDERLTNALTNDGLNYADFVTCRTQRSFKFNFMLRHLLSSLLIDLILKIMKKEPMLTKIRRRLLNVFLVSYKFMCTRINFQTDRFDSLLDHLDPEDKKTFGWRFNKDDIIDMNVNAYNISKKTFLKELFANITRYGKWIKMLYVMDKVSLYLIYFQFGLLIYYTNLHFLLTTAVLNLFTLNY